MSTADRYAVTGGEVPRIYFGCLAGLRQAIKDAQHGSLRGKTRRLLMDLHGERAVLHVYEDGELTWTLAAQEG